MLHCDVKPENIVMREDSLSGGVPIPAFVDLGIGETMTKVALQDDKVAELKGSFPYLSPQREQHKLQPTAQDDIYSLGLVFYQMLTRQVPFYGQTTVRHTTLEGAELGRSTTRTLTLPWPFLVVVVLYLLGARALRKSG